MGDHIIHRAKIGKDGELVLDDSPGLLFPWWSFTKTAMGSAALQLVAQGRLRLEETLPGRPYTLRQLLQHRAGVPEYGRLASYHQAVERRDEPWTVEELLAEVDAASLDFPPDQGWRYSNVGYLFVRQIIEKTMDDHMGAALQTLVFDPLDIHSVRLARTPEDLDDTAWGNESRYHPGWVYHGLLVGTALDSVRFLEALASGRVLPPPLLDIMNTGHPVDGVWPGRPWQEASYGLGVMNGAMSGVGRVFGHSGMGPDSISAVYHFPECQPPCTVAAFAEETEQGVCEWAAARLAT